MSKIVLEGHIDDILLQDGFAVHDTMFSVKDVIQCMFLASKTMYDFYVSSSCNCFAITLNTRDGWIMSTPMTTNNKFNAALDRNSDSSKIRRPNTYTMHDEDHILILLSKGFVMDNFIMKESYHDFRLVENEPHIMVYATDFESLTMKNPNLE